MRNRKGVQWKLCALALGVASSSLAQAQEEHRLEAITVEGNRLYDLPSSEQSGGYGVDAATVGTKTPASLRDIPQSITVLTHDYVQDRQFVTLDQAAKYTPGIHTLANDDGRSSIFSRGYEYSEYNVDGLPAPISSLWGTLPLIAAFDRIHQPKSRCEIPVDHPLSRKNGTEPQVGPWKDARVLVKSIIIEMNHFEIPNILCKFF